MVALSLMPPVDYCASCEGQKAEVNARAIANAREAEASATREATKSDSLSPGALPPITDAKTNAKPVDTVARPLLSPDLAVQASLAKAESSPIEPGDNPTLRLQAFQAYGVTPGRGPGS